METKEPNTIRLGTRGSLLARAQSEQIADRLRALQSNLRIELYIVKTTGDRIADRPLHELGGKGLFTKELELALLSGEIDFAVHSYKDVPVTMPLVDASDLVIAAVPQREDSRDILVAGPSVRSIQDLSGAATVGTGSLRRQCMLKAIRPDLNVIPLRGNIDTRLRKQREGEMQAVVLAAAGLLRSNLFNTANMAFIPAHEMVPAAGQGALALQCRAADKNIRELLAQLNDPVTQQCVKIERNVIQMLNADCRSPVGVHAALFDQHHVQVQIAIGSEHSDIVHRYSHSGEVSSIDKDLAGILKDNKNSD